MPVRDSLERDILVASNEYAYVQDLTKGDIVLYCGPTKISLSNTERLVEFRDGRFVQVRTEDGSMGVNPFIVASSAQYIILENPPKDPTIKTVKGNNSAIELLIGRKIVAPGPATFPLWPGQRAMVIDGHELREDQYLVVRMYEKVEGDDGQIGTERIVKGSEVSFYIPKTGYEIVPDESGYIRNAVTLLDGEYCILLSPNGKRRYCRGSDVVFPEPMEEFVQVGRTKIFKAYQLKRSMGLHIRVVKDFSLSEEDQVSAGKYSAGQELFIRDREGYFYPTENIEIINVVNSIPIGDKEGIYVRNLETGKIVTEIGPKTYLLDPTKFEIISRTLDPEIAKLYALASIDKAKAISIYIPPSYAILVTAKNKREVVTGPKTRILDYDEDLEILKLSTGKPKVDTTLLSTSFLLVTGNKVSDIVKVKTHDHVELEALLSYRVSFISEGGDNEKWFNVKNYVGLLCDHLASLVRAAARNSSIENFNNNSAEIIRTAILGEKKGEEKRPGRFFSENGLLVYDVEVLDIKILDSDVKKLLSDAQRSSITSEVQKKQEELRLGNEKLKQEVDFKIFESQISTISKAIELEKAKMALSETQVTASIELNKIEMIGKANNEAEALKISNSAKVMASDEFSNIEIKSLNSKVNAFKEQMAAIQPELITVLKVLGEQQMAAELTKNLSPLAILGGKSVAEIAEKLLKALPVGLNIQDGLLQSLSSLQKEKKEVKKKE